MYSDTYFDRAGQLTRADQELRVRHIHADGATTTLLTFKGAVVDAETQSKTERETAVADPEALKAIFLGLGYEVFVAFDKHCTNYRFTRQGRDMLATVVTVPQIDGTFLEVETIIAVPGDLTPALDAIREVLAELGIPRNDETRDTYTAAVILRRPARPG